MRKKNLIFTKKNIVKLFLTLTILCISNACSSSSEDPMDDENKINLAEATGRYLGSFNSNLADFSVSMIIKPSTSNRYVVEIYISSDFKPGHNSDGKTPELKGDFVIDGNMVTTTLNFLSDLPPCTGTYTGSGTRDTTKGQFKLDMTFAESCNNGDEVTGPFTFTFTKLSN